LTGVAFILVPVCETCQKAFRQKYRRAFWRPMTIVLLVIAVVGFAVGTLPALTGRDPRSFPILPILCSLGLVMVSLPVAWIVFKRRALKAVPPPVQFRRYIRNREVSFRFRRPEYTADVIALQAGAARSAEH
jgi:protein-S-isoprenylcysteine O-methyltransferase Ste14